MSFFQRETPWRGELGWCFLAVSPYGYGGVPGGVLLGEVSVLRFLPIGLLPAEIISQTSQWRISGGFQIFSGRENLPGGRSPKG